MRHMSWNIIANRGHYEVYADGEFVLTADTKAEAMEEMEEWENKLTA